jgi:hypothetical protein
MKGVDVKECDCVSWYEFERMGRRRGRKKERKKAECETERINS